MGFTVNSPELRLKVRERVHRMNGDISREAEDAAVAELVEEVLAQPSAAGASSNVAQAAASGSGAQLRRSNTSIPGSWV